MTRSEMIERIHNEYRELAERDLREAEERAAEAGRRDPEIARILTAKSDLALECVRLTITDRENAAAHGRRMRDEGQKMNRELRQRLVAAGMEENALDVQYHCSLCKDTGYVGEPVKQYCECFKRRLNQLIGEDRGLAAMNRESFETYRDEFIPETVLANGVSQRVYTRALMEACRRYADAYPNPEKSNLLMHGGTGLGKSFLLNAMAGRLYRRGYNVLRVTAYTMFETMRKYHFGKETDDTLTFDDLLNTPVLFIDDLGSEPMMQNITVEYLFVLLNERLHSGLGTVIATNLSPAKIKEHYLERVFSRLCDRGNTMILEFLGEDLRSHGNR